MEFIFELILELALDGTVEVVQDRKVPKYIRYPLLAILALLFLAVIGLIIFAGIMVLEENILVGVFLILLGLLLFVVSIIQFRKTYLIKISKE